MSRACQLVFFLFSLCAISQNIEDKEKLVEKFYFKGLEFSNTQKDSSYHYYRQALRHAEDLQHYSDAIEILFGMILTGRKHGDINNHLLFLEHIDMLLIDNDIQVKLDDYQYYENRFTYEKATYYYDLLDYDRAKKSFRKLYRHLSKKQLSTLDEFEYNLLIHTTNYLALIYSHNSKYDLAETYFNRSLAYIENHPVEDSETYRLATLQLLAQLHRFTNNISKSNDFLTTVLKAYKARFANNEGYKNNVNAAFNKLVENAIDQGKWQRALSYLQEGQQYLLDDDPFYKDYLILYGDIYAGQEEGQKSLGSYHEALRLFQEHRQNNPHQDIAKIYGKIAILQLRQKNYQEGLLSIQKAFNTAGNNIKIANFKNNPDPKEVFSKTQLLYLLDIKLQLLQESYELTSDKVYGDAILQIGNDILETFDHLKSEFDSKLDKQFLAEKAYPISHHMLEAAYRVNENAPSSKVLQLALNIAEKNKDFLLMEALRSAQASKYANIPQEISDKETQLRAEITYLEKEIFDTTDFDEGFSESLFKVKQEYYSFLDSVKIAYPKYHSLKYQTTFIDLEAIRKKLLDDNGTLLSYTLTDSYLYAIVVNDRTNRFLKIPFSESDRQMIRDFYELLSKPSVKESKTSISNLGRTLYDKLLKIPLHGFDVENLTIIPDGELHYLPFDMLINGETYLLENTNVGYGNSIASLIELKQKQYEGKDNILAFAPSFSGLNQKIVEREFGKLLYNDDEVHQIQSYFDTDIYVDSSATLTNFMRSAPNQNMIHLATHASANDEFPDYSYLAFSENTDEEDNILYIKDLYNMSLNADMVTLSGCQTGIGKLQKGQGMMSLSKGFYYAGAKSLVNTLWKINDKSTVKLMEFFYEGLSKGKSKTEALREAKLKYLKNTDDELLKHPYYWSAFVVSGDASAISNNNTLWWLLGFGIFSLVALWIFSKKKTDFGKIQLQN